MTGPEGFAAAYVWDTVRVLRYLSTRNGVPWDARYTLLDPQGAAVNIGPGTRVFLKDEKRALGITSLVQGALFLWPDVWGEHILRTVTRAQLPKVLAALERGGTVDFGAYKVDQHVLSGRKHSAPWSQITEISSYSGTLIFNGSLKRTTVDSADLQSIANPDLFLRLCRHLMGRARTHHRGRHRVVGAWCSPPSPKSHPRSRHGSPNSSSARCEARDAQERRPGTPGPAGPGPAGPGPAGPGPAGPGPAGCDLRPRCHRRSRGIAR